MIRSEPTETPAAKELRIFLERIERLQEERKAIADDVADLFKEMTGKGYDKDAAKIVLKIRASAEGLTAYTERSSTVDLYLSALGMLPKDEPDRAPARTHGNVTQIRPTGDRNRHPATAVTSNLAAAREGDESAAPEFDGESRERTSRETGECPEAPLPDGALTGPAGTAATGRAPLKASTEAA